MVSNFFKIMKSKFITTGIISFVLCILSATPIFAQTCTVSGFVDDKETGEKLIGAYISINKTGGTVTNNSGFYSISKQAGDTILLVFSYVGYGSVNKKIVLTENKTVNVSLTAVNQLKEVVINANRGIERTPEAGVLSIMQKQFKTMPSLGGEADILKVFQTMPGVQGGQEGAVALYVRGGTPDENLYLLDDIPLYYVNHLGGFLSVFDENAINSIKLIKGGFPAQYGGRLSSILDIRLKDGNKFAFHGEAKLDALATKLFVEGPLPWKKGSFMISVRRSNVDLYTRSFFQEDVSGGKDDFGYVFYDANAKINLPITRHDNISITSYWGLDKVFDNYKGTGSAFASPFLFKTKWNNNWGNTLAGIRWNHSFTDKLFCNLAFSYTGFHYEDKYMLSETDNSTGQVTASSENTFFSGIKDIGAKLDLEYYPSAQQKIKIGAKETLHYFTPSSYVYNNSNVGTVSIDTSFGDKTLKAHEINVYITDELEIGNHFSANIGIHGAAYSAESHQYQSIEPRITANYLLTDNLSVKASYSRMTQFVHLLSSSSIGLPTDMWLPATPRAVPEESDQYSLGFARTLKKHNIELSIDGFYKQLRHLIDFKEGSSFSQIGNWEDKIEADGKGLVYGVELMARKQTGKFNGWISYTLSKNTRQFDNINDGAAYPFKFDRRHDISVVLNYNLNEHITFSACWQYMTGNAVTLALGTYNAEAIQAYHDNPTRPFVYNQYLSYNQMYQYQMNEAQYYGGKNNYKMPAYHRLDISANFTKQKKHGKRVWQVGVYNVYNHKNPYFLYYRYDNASKTTKLYEYCIFPIIPSVSYSFVF